MSRPIGEEGRDGARFAESAERNKGPILEVLKRVLPCEGLVLEIASGTGQHAVHFAAALPRVAWQPSDVDASLRDSVSSWVRASGLANVRDPVALDVTRRPWPVAAADAVVCINMIHIAPWEAALALLKGAASILREGGVLYLYGPYRRRGAHTAPSNERFDAELRSRDPRWGVRDLEAVVDVARANGLALREVAEMPANNLSVVFEKTKAEIGPRPAPGH